MWRGGKKVKLLSKKKLSLIVVYQFSPEISRVLQFTMWRQDCYTWHYHHLSEFFFLLQVAHCRLTGWNVWSSRQLQPVATWLVGFCEQRQLNFAAKCLISFSATCLYSSLCCREAHFMLSGDVKRPTETCPPPRDTLFSPQVSSEEVDLCQSAEIMTLYFYTYARAFNSFSHQLTQLLSFPFNFKRLITPPPEG